jgi:cysteinyl-tRNA synthetase
MTPLQLSNTRTRAKQVTYVQNITDVDDKIIRRTREEHRRNRRFADADRIRDQLAAYGVILEDSPTGVRWRPSTR